ncbi:MAG: hypothetical protein J5379_03675 [Clostridiales bacterium]|nr:hypothetical protein [Clostridiales bacterium]
MDPLTAIVIALLLIYLIAPIPLLIFLISSRGKISAARSERAVAEARAREIEAQYRHSEENHKYKEEQYRLYVKQLQNQIKELDPDAQIGFIRTPSTSKEPVPENTSAGASSASAAVTAPAATVAEPAGTPAQQPVPIPIPTPDPAPVFRPIPQYTPASQPVPQTTSAPQPIPQYVAPKTSQTAKTPVKDNTLTPLILTIGVILLLLASIGFISATWSILSIGVRAAALLSFSAIFVAAGIFAGTKLKLPNTSIAFYSIGSAALPITIYGAGAFHLLGDTFGLSVPAIYHTTLLAFGSLLVLLAFGAFFFRSRVFAAGSLICSSICIFTLPFGFTFAYSLDVLVIALFASAAVFLAPYVEKIPESSRAYPYSKVFTVYSIINLYAMTLIALLLSRLNIWSGLFLLALSAAFFCATILRKETGLLSLPAIVLMLVGTAQIIKPEDLLGLTIWMLVAGVTFAALSFVPYFKKIFSGVLLAFGLFFLIVSALPTYIYGLEYNNWAFLALCIVPCVALTFLSAKKNYPLVFAGALFPAFSLLWFTALHLVSFATPFDASADGYLQIGTSPYMVSGYWVALLGFLIAGAMYFVFNFIPHHRFYTGTGNIFLFILMVCFGEFFITEVNDTYYMWFFLLNLGFIVLSLIQGSRTDRLNVRNTSVDKMPSSITMTRGFYSLIWAVFVFIFFVGRDSFSRNHNMVSLIGMLLFMALCYGYAIFHIVRAGSGSDALSWNSYKTVPRAISVWTALCTFGLLLFVMVLSDIARADNHPVFFVIQHLVPLLVPILFLILLVLEIRNRRDPSGVKADYSFGYTLVGLFLLIPTLPYALDIANGFSVSSIYLGSKFVFAVLALLSIIYFVVRRCRSENKDLSVWKSLSSVNRALLIWTSTISIVLIISAMIGIPYDEYPVLPILLGLILLGYIMLYDRSSIIVTAVVSTLMTILYIIVINHYRKTSFAAPGWAMVLLYQVPVLIYCIAVLLRKKDFLHKEPLFWSALASQGLVFLLTPVLTISATKELANDAFSYSDYAHTSKIIDKLVKGFSYSFNPSRVLVFTLIGFLLIELIALLRSRDQAGRSRAIALMGVTVSTIVWMPILTCPSLSNLVEACYLIPPTVFVLLMPWIFPLKEIPAGTNYTLVTYASIDHYAPLRFVYACVAMGILAVLTLNTSDTFCLIFFGVISFVILLLGYFIKDKGYLILGTICVLGMLAYIANKVWGNMSWLIYLFVTGSILITIAVRNEIKKRK